MLLLVCGDGQSDLQFRSFVAVTVSLVSSCNISTIPRQIVSDFQLLT